MKLISGGIDEKGEFNDDENTHVPESTDGSFLNLTRSWRPKHWKL